MSQPPPDRPRPAVHLPAVTPGADTAAAHRGSVVAAALLARAIGQAPAHLWVFRTTLRAQAFYAKHDFVVDGHRRADPDTGVWEQRFVGR